MGKRRKDLSGAFNARAAPAKGGAGAGKKARLEARLSNPFEVRQNKKQKHTVLNKKLKGAKRNVALSRSLAYEKRKRTLLSEVSQSSKANTFLDKRFGEKDKSLTEEERVLERFKRLRSKRELYNLGDTDAAAGGKKPRHELTHLGQSLSKDGVEDTDMKEFERMLRAEGLDNDDDDEGYDDRIDANQLMQDIKNGERTGGSERDNRSKKDIMEEVIAKAKMFKMQRQREKEEDEDERERLDDAFKGLMQQGLFHLRPTKKEEQARMMAEMVQRLKDGTGADKVPDQNKAAEEPDEYEQTVRGLMFEARAAATDRTMTPEEEAKRERDKLEEQQKELERRMEGRVSDDESDDEERRGGSKRRKGRKKDAFFDAAEDEDDDEDEDEDEDEDSGGDDESLEGDEVMEMHLKEHDKAMKASDKKNKTSKKRKVGIDKRADIILEAKTELPFILDAPETHIDFVGMLKSYPKASLGTVVERVRKCNSIHLLAENRAKLHRFLGILVEHLVLVVEQGAMEEDAGKLGEGREACKQCLQAIYDVAHDVPNLAAQLFCTRLARMQARLASQLGAASAAGKSGGGDYGCESSRVALPEEMLKMKKRGGHKGAKGRAAVELEKEELEQDLEQMGGGILLSDARCWPSPGDLAFFRAVQLVFPATDFRHVVVSPAQLLLCQYLSQCPVRGPRDVVAALCTSQTLLDFVRGAKRLAPELQVALEALSLQALRCAPRPAGRAEDVARKPSWVLPKLLQEGRRAQGAPQLDWLRRGFLGLISANDEAATLDAETPALSLHLLSYAEDNGQADITLCSKVLAGLCHLCVQYSEIAQSVPAGDVLLEGIVGAFDAACKEPSGDSAARTLVEKTAAKLGAALTAARQQRKPMRLLQQVAKSIKVIEPLFNENYKWTKDGHDPDRYRAEMKKLKKQVNRERKGVARELRKDAQFLSEQRQNEKQKRADELRAERQRNFSLVTQQAGEIDKSVREIGARGGGSRAADMRGRKRVKRD